METINMLCAICYCETDILYDEENNALPIYCPQCGEPCAPAGMSELDFHSDEDE